METWKIIPGFENYKVSDMGRIKSSLRSKKILKPKVDKDGYRRLGLFNDKERKFLYVHRLVLMSFVGMPLKNIQGCHNDGNPSNNKLSNLRWGTIKENYFDRYKHGTDYIGSKHPKAKLTEKDVKEILNKRKKSDLTHKEIGKLYGVKSSTICNICNGHIWKHLTNNKSQGKI